MNKLNILNNHGLILLNSLYNEKNFFVKRFGTPIGGCSYIEGGGGKLPVLPALFINFQKIKKIKIVYGFEWQHWQPLLRKM